MKIKKANKTWIDESIEKLGECLESKDFGGEDPEEVEKQREEKAKEINKRLDTSRKNGEKVKGEDHAEDGKPLKESINVKDRKELSEKLSELKAKGISRANINIARSIEEGYRYTVSYLTEAYKTTYIAVPKDMNNKKLWKTFSDKEEAIEFAKSNDDYISVREINKVVHDGIEEVESEKWVWNKEDSVNEGVLSKSDKEFTRDELADLESKLAQAFKDRGLFYEASFNKAESPLCDLDLVVEIDGDWKHDHLAAEHIIDQFCRENKFAIARHDVDITRDVGDDDYGAIHTFSLVIDEDGKMSDTIGALKHIFSSKEESLEESKSNKKLREMYNDFVIEDKFIEYMKSQGIENPVVFDEEGFFVDGVYEKYAQGVADTYLDGNIDWLDGLCNEERCFRENEEHFDVSSEPYYCIRLDSGDYYKEDGNVKFFDSKLEAEEFRIKNKLFNGYVTWDDLAESLKEDVERKEEDKGNPYDPEKLPDEGLSQEELDKCAVEKDCKESLEEVAREEYCVLVNGNNEECFSDEEEAIKFARKRFAEEGNDSVVKVHLIKYGPKDEHGDEPEIGFENIWSSHFDESIARMIAQDAEDSKSNNKKVKIIYGSSPKEAKANKPIKVTLKQLDDYKNNYSYVEVIEESLDEGRYSDLSNRLREKEKELKELKIKFENAPTEEAKQELDELIYICQNDVANLKGELAEIRYVDNGSASDYSGYEESLKEDITDEVENRVEELRDVCKDLSAEELYKTASNEHLWALGSETDEEATMHEINADAYRILAKEKESNESLKESVDTSYIDIIVKALEKISAKFNSKFKGKYIYSHTGKNPVLKGKVLNITANDIGTNGFADVKLVIDIEDKNGNNSTISTTCEKISSDFSFEDKLLKEGVSADDPGVVEAYAFLENNSDGYAFVTQIRTNKGTNQINKGFKSDEELRKFLKEYEENIKADDDEVLDISCMYQGQQENFRDIVMKKESLTESRASDLDLPSEVEVSIGELDFEGDFVDLDDSEIEDILSDYLSDTYGYCHYGFKWKGKEGSNDHLICYDIQWDTSSEDDEDLKDKVESVLEEYGILYGDVVDYDDRVNIVGVDEAEWEEVFDAIKYELGLDALVPDYDHEELDDEIIVMKECLKEGMGLDDYITVSKQNELTKKHGSYEYARKLLVKEFRDKVKELPYWVIKTSEWWDPEGLNIPNDKYSIWFGGSEEECKSWLKDKYQKSLDDKEYCDVEKYEDGKYLTVYYPHAVARATYTVTKNLDNLDEDAESKVLKISPDSKKVEIDIEDKSEVGEEGHPIQKGLKGLGNIKVHEEINEVLDDEEIEVDDEMFVSDELVDADEVDDEFGKMSFDDKMDFLAKDEEEAIDGYDKVIDTVEDEHVKDQLEHIRDEEVAHKEFLDAVKEDPSIEYEHEDEKEEEVVIVDEIPEDEDNDDGFGVFESLSDNELVQSLVANGSCADEKEAKERVARMSKEDKDSLSKSIKAQAARNLLDD